MTLIVFKIKSGQHPKLNFMTSPHPKGQVKFCHHFCFLICCGIKI